MRERIYDFKADGLVVHWDYLRCIHVEECVRGLPEVFDPDRRPWIDPSLATPDEVADVCERCPTGALHYDRTDGKPPEQTPQTNQITVSSDGPLFVRGDVHIVDAEDQTLLRDTRVALCRCGHSRNKPLCDGSHEKSEFRSSGALTDAHLSQGDGQTPEPDELKIKAVDPGPLKITGSAELRSEGSNECCHVRVGALCCCGRSSNKPFCDGTHNLAP